MSKFKIGDKVRVTNLERYGDDPGLDSDGFMKKQLGKIFTIRLVYLRCDGSQRYAFEEIRCSWDERWLEKVSPAEGLSEYED